MAWVPTTPEHVYEQWLKQATNKKVYDSYIAQTTGTNPALLQLAKDEWARRCAKALATTGTITSINMRGRKR